MKKPTTNSLPGSASPAGQKRKYAAIFIVAVVAVLVLGALVFVLPKQKGVVGKAYQVTQPGTFPAQGPKEVRFGTDTANAAPGDEFTLPVFIKSDAAVSQFNFELGVPTGIELLPSGCPTTDIPCTVDTHTSLGMVGFPIPGDPTWSIAGTGNGVSGADVKLFTLHFRVLSGATISETPVNIQITAGEMVSAVGNTIEVLAENLLATSQVTVVETCTDTDEDNYGAIGTELRACDVPNQADCDDSNQAVKPSAAESCNGVDDNCDGTADNGLTAGANTNMLGVCHGTQICTGVTNFQDSYLVTNPADFSTTAVTFTSPEGTFTQQELYSASAELCDFFDNNCDGSVNEDLADCSLGEGEASIVGAPPGNVFVDYYPVNADDAFADNTHKDPQQLGLFDRLLFNKMKILYTGVCDITGYPACAGAGGIPPTCGFSGLAPCGPNPFTATSRIYLCSNGVYYLEDITSGNPAGTATRFSPTEDKQSGINVATLENCE